ncbi:MAG: hypothetical protein AAB560_03645 [Patescibacteria group bacterium]
MSFSLVYLGYRFLYRVAEFFHRWYVRGFFVYGRAVLNVLLSLDKTLALRITLRHFGEPLYRDYTVLGYILGFVLRGLRIAVALAIYPVVLAFAGALFLVWMAIPVFIIYKIIFG